MPSKVLIRLCRTATIFLWNVLKSKWISSAYAQATYLKTRKEFTDQELQVKLATYF